MLRHSRTHFVGFALAAAVGVSPVSPALGAQPEIPSDAPTEAVADPFEAGLRAYERKAFDEAIALFEDAYARDPKPVILYAWAQATREAGDCPRAIELYQQFLESNVEGQAAVAARENINRCEAEAPPAQVSPPSPVVAPQPEAPPPRPAGTAAPPEKNADPRTPKPSALGITLVVIGGLGTIAGGTLLGIAEARRTRQSNADDYTSFDDLDGSIDRFYIGGGVALGLGIGLLAGGIIRLALHQNRQPTARRPSVGIGVGPGGTGTLTLAFGRR